MGRIFKDDIFFTFICYVGRLNQLKNHNELIYFFKKNLILKKLKD